MIIRKNTEDNCYLVKMEHRARCVECLDWLKPGSLAWSYLPAPHDGNYVSCGQCRYGCDPTE